MSICTYVLHNIASAAACDAGDDWTPYIGGDLDFRKYFEKYAGFGWREKFLKICTDRQ